MFAGQAVELSDSELDNVYAEGLNFQFDSFFGSTNNLLKPEDIKVNKTGTNQQNVVITNDPKQQFQLLTPPQTINNQNNPPVNTSSNQPTINNQSATSVGPIAQPQSFPQTFNQANDILNNNNALNSLEGNSGNIEDLGVPSNSNASVPDNILSAASPLGNNSIDQPVFSQTSAPLDMNNTPTPTNNLADNLTSTTGAAQQIINTPQSQTNTVTPTTTTTSNANPTSTSPQPLQLDMVAAVSNNGKIDFAIKDPTQNFTPPQAPTTTTTTTNNPASSAIDNLIPSNLNSLPGTGGLNVVNVRDSSQTFLSALVNVNSAGSVVPVQINLTIIMNSQVQNLTNNNALELSNFFHYQFNQ